MLCFLESSCGDSSSSTDNAAAGPEVVSVYVNEPMPGTADSARVAFHDLNYYTSDGQFCTVAIVENLSPQWQRFWVRISLLDSTGATLRINQDTSIVVRALSDAVPPRGATAFFSAIPLGQISGVPVSCRVTGAGAVPQTSGPILLAVPAGGVRMLIADPAKPEETTEKLFQASAVIENPLELMAGRPRIVWLLYGKDEKLYFAQALAADKNQQILILEKEGPMMPQEKRNVRSPIHYEQLPTALREVLIGRAEVQAYEGR